MIVDTHAHLASSQFSDRLDETIQRAVDAGVTRMIAIGTDLEDSRRALEIAEKHPEVYATVGIHPTDVLEIDAPDWLEQLTNLAAHERCVAIGEIGLDHFHPPKSGTKEDYYARQAEYCTAQLELAVSLRKNVVIHQRECAREVVEIVRPFDGKLRAVFHCYLHPWENAQPLIDAGHLISFTGIATFKNAQETQSCARDAADGSFMLETDAPYLAPVPFRGKRCEPMHTRNTAEHIANLRGITLEQLAAETTKTAETFFGIPSI